MKENSQTNYIDIVKNAMKRAEEAKHIQPAPKPYHRGYFTGAFDVLNQGHVISIQKAASLCDQLIVGVSTDEVIRDYKHHEPAVSFEERIAIINGIKGVSLAIPQDNLYNKQEVCNSLDIDVLFSCEEYQRDYYKEPENMTQKQIAGVERWEKFEEELSQDGISVVYLPRSETTSSSIIKQRIVEQSGCQEPAGIMIYSEGESCDEANFAL